MSSKKARISQASEAVDEKIPASTGTNIDACDLMIDVDLEGVRLPRLARLRTGDPLNVELRAEGRYPTVVCLDDEGEIVGALSAFVNLIQLIKCLQSGVKYRVEVTQLRPGGCRVAGGRVF